MLVKVCGMADSRNMLQVAALKPDMLGFVFYPTSPRYAGYLPEKEVKTLDEDILRVAVFVNEEADKMEHTACRYGISVLQLHGNETPDLCGEMRMRGFKVIKALGVETAGDFRMLPVYEKSCDWFLFDTKSKKYGGTGQKFSWSLLRAYRGELPFLLSGGIGVEDVEKIEEVKENEKFAGVDLNSRFEKVPGVKDTGLLIRFMEKLKH